MNGVYPVNFYNLRSKSKIYGDVRHRREICTFKNGLDAPMR